MLYKVINDFLPTDLLKHVNDNMLNDNFPWFYHQYVAEEGEDTADEFYFTHTFFDGKRREINSPFHEDIMVPFLFVFMGKEYDLIRAKSNMFTRRDKQIKYGLHKDYAYDKHTTLVFSNNTNNGGTEFEDGTFIPSIENQLLVFDGNIKHRSVGQTDTNHRINLNINLMHDPKRFINE